MARGVQQEKFAIAMPIEPLLEMSLDDDIFKNPSELQIVKKFIFKGPRTYWIRTIRKKEN